MRARATGALPNLNEHIGEGWGSNGDVALARPLGTLEVGTQGTPSASRILDEAGAPVALENWFIPGATPLRHHHSRIVGHRARRHPRPVRLQPGRPARGPAVATRRRCRLSRASAGSQQQRGRPLSAYLPPALDADASFTSHPLGGAVIGRATDGYGRVRGYRSLYVMDGAAVPGSTGTVNPSLTISALAERNIEQIIRSGG